MSTDPLHSFAPSAPFRTSAIQMDPVLGATEHNMDTILKGLASAAHDGAQLALFPECALTGYVVNTAADAREIAIPLDPSSIMPLVETCRKHAIHAIVGAIEQDLNTDDVYNSAWILGPDGLIGRYRKTHLPFLGVDRFVTYGDSLPVFDLPFGRVGVLICYDLRFPEAARTLTLAGADLIAVPTNWPQGAESAPDFLTRARAWENRVYLVACNRIGVEAEVRFIGRSQIIAPDGEYLGQADDHSFAILTAEIDPAKARNKRVVIKPGEFEMDPVGGRRPKLYCNLI